MTKEEKKKRVKNLLSKSVDAKCLGEAYMNGEISTFQYLLLNMLLDIEIEMSGHQ